MAQALRPAAAWVCAAESCWSVGAVGVGEMGPGSGRSAPHEGHRAVLVREYGENLAEKAVSHLSQVTVNSVNSFTWFHAFLESQLLV